MIARFRLALVGLALLIAGCVTAPTVKDVAVEVGTVSFTTLAEGLTYFKGQYPKDLASMKAAAIATCKGRTTKADYKVCTDALLKPREQPITDVLDAIRLFDALGNAGVEASDGRLLEALASLLKALDVVKIRVSLPGGAS